MCAELLQSCPTLCDPMDYNQHNLLCAQDSPGKKTGMGCLPLLQRIFLTQGLNHCLLSPKLAGGFLTTSAPYYGHFQTHIKIERVQFIFAQSCPTLSDPMDCSMPGCPVHHQLLELAQTHIYWVGDTIQPSHPLLSPSPPVFNLSQHQGLFQWVSSSHQVAKVLEFQLQHQSFQWIFRTDFL